nr:leucine-rich repeat protein [Tanacetum cinerariifolium]
MGHLIAKFELIGFECLVNINERIIPRFVLEFYSQLTFDYNFEGHFVVNFVIQNKSFSLTVEEFGHILKILFEGHVYYTDMWSLDYLAINTSSKGRHKTTPPSPSVIKSLIQTPRQGQLTRTRNKKIVVVNENEILTRKIQNHMKLWVEIIHENVLCLEGHRDHVLACLFSMLYCIETSTQYNLAFFILKRMERTQNKPKELLPYGMLLTKLFNHVVSIFTELAIDHYILYDRVMHSFAPYYERKTRSDHGMKRCPNSNPSSSSTTLNHSSSSYHIDENVDDNDKESFHSSTPSLPQLISSLSNVVPRVFENLPHELALPSLAKPSLAYFSIQAMLFHSITSLPLFKSYNYYTSPLPSSSSLFSSPSSSMSCSNAPPNFFRKTRILVKVWRQTTLTPKSPPSSQDASPSLPPRVNPQSHSPPSHNPLRDQMINQLYNIFSILESQTQNSPNAYSHASYSPPSPLIHPPTNPQVEFHFDFCHCCSGIIPPQLGNLTDLHVLSLGSFRNSYERTSMMAKERPTQEGLRQFR